MSAKIDAHTDAVKKKRGKKGDFGGARLKILEDHLPAYQAASKESSAAVHTWFTNVFFPHYWSKFHWSLPMNQDVPDDESQLLPANDEDLDVEQRKTKKEMVQAMVKKIKTWFNYRRHSLGLHSGKDPWLPLLEKVRQINDAPPRRLLDCQYYMNMDEFKPKCDLEYEKVWPTLGLDQDYMVSIRVKTAKQLLEGEQPDVQERVNTLAQEAHEEAVKKYNKGLWVPDTLDPDEQAQAIASLTSTVQPLLDGIRAITGLHLCLLAASTRVGSANKMTYICLNAGRTHDGKDFSELDPPKFRQTVRNFCGYVLAAEGGGRASDDGNGDTLLDPSGSRPEEDRAPVDERASLRTLKTTDLLSSPATSLSPRTPTEAAAVLNPCSQRTLPIPAAPSDPIELLAKAKAATKSTLDALGIEVCQELLTELSKLNPSEKKRRMHELARISQYEVEIENNKARNRALAMQLGVGDASLLFGAAQAKQPEQPSVPEDDDDYAPATRNIGAANIVQTRRSKRNKGSTSTEPPTADAHPASSSDASPSPSVPSSSSANNDKTVPLDGVTDADTDDGQDSEHTNVASPPWVTAPKWFAEGVEHFSKLSKDTYCPAWFEAVNAWRQMEEASGFPEWMLGTTSRPVQVGKWIKSARPYKYHPEIEDVDAYVAGWWKWWRAINPDWRSESGSAHLAREASGQWEALQVTGANGTLSVLASLWFWREKIPDTSPTLASWKEAVADVNWALHEVLRSKKRPAAAEEDEDEAKDATRSSRKRARAA